MLIVDDSEALFTQLSEILINQRFELVVAFLKGTCTDFIILKSGYYLIQPSHGWRKWMKSFQRHKSEILQPKNKSYFTIWKSFTEYNTNDAIEKLFTG